MNLLNIPVRVMTPISCYALIEVLIVNDYFVDCCIRRRPHLWMHWVWLEQLLGVESVLRQRA